MSNITPFMFDNNAVRVVTGNDGEPWFVAADVASVLGYEKPRNAVAAHCRGALKQGVLTAGGEQEMTIIPERDVYRLVMRSKLPSAERFEEWVVGEVLPSIRKTGSYQFAIPKTLSEALQLAADQARQLEAAKPAVEFMDRYVEAKSAKGIREVAKILGAKEREFVSFLLDNHIMFRQGPNLLPYAEHQHAGRFVVKTGETNGHAFHQSRFTPDGIAWIANRWAGFVRPAPNANQMTSAHARS